MALRLLVGTKQGLYTFTSKDRERWTRAGPYLKEWDVPDVAVSDGTAYAAVDNRKANFGQLVGTVFTAKGHFTAWKKTGLVSLWPHLFTLAAAGRRLYAGFEPVSLGRSTDGGRTWLEVGSLRSVPGTFEWWGPAEGARCFVSSIIVDRKNGKRLWVGSSGGGLWRTEDACRTWQSASWKIREDSGGPGLNKYGDSQLDIHVARGHPRNPDVLYMGNHPHVRASTNGGRSWRIAEAGLPECRGDRKQDSYKAPVIRSLALHPRDGRRAFTVPLTWSRQGVPALKGQLGVGRTSDGGRHWEVIEKGLPTYKDANTFRHCMDADDGNPVGVYFGTREGDLFASGDEGDSWVRVAKGLPPIRSVRVTGTP